MFQKRKLTLPFIWILLVYLSIPYIRKASEFILENYYLKFSLLSFILLSLIIVILRAISRKEKVILLGLGATFAYLYSFRLHGYEELFHYFEYGVFSILILNSFKADLKERNKIIITNIIVLCFGYFDEIIQYFTPGRFFDWNDVLLNFVSGILGVIVYYSAISTTLDTN